MHIGLPEGHEYLGPTVAATETNLSDIIQSFSQGFRFNLAVARPPPSPPSCTFVWLSCLCEIGVSGSGCYHVFDLVPPGSPSSHQPVDDVY